MSAVENIRAALADARTGPWIGAGPSFGAPQAEYLDSVVEDVDNDCAATICRDTETGDALYIAACNPAAMTAVLAHIDAQAAEIEGLKADAAQMLTTLTQIRNANPRDWDELSCKVTEFERWAKARASHSILLNAAIKEKP